MNLIPEKQPESCNYICTWGEQNRAAVRYGVAGATSFGVRDVLDEHYLFEEDFYHFMPAEYRSGLIFLLDDGWDVPYGSNQTPEAGPFGSVDPDREKFRSFGDTPEERLINLSNKVKQMGYAGLGLWISPQVPFSEKQPDMDAARAHWEKCAKWCGAADIKYWKVDWGLHSKAAGYREMMTECVRKYAPNLIIEHAHGNVPFSSRDLLKPAVVNEMCEIFAYSDSFRTYDVMKPFDNSDSVARADALLSNLDQDGFRLGAKGYVNVESQPLVGAGLGFHVGLMGYSRDAEAALRWQRLCPAFSVQNVSYDKSGESLTESHYFDTDPCSWIHMAGKLYTFEVPAVMARGTKAPKMEGNGLKPIILACQNPDTKAYTVVALRRMVEPNTQIISLADVTIYPGSIESPVGAFGYYKSLTLEYEEPIPEHSRIWAQCMLSDEAQDVTDRVTVDGNRIIIDGTTLRQLGISDITRKEPDNPAVVLVIK